MANKKSNIEIILSAKDANLNTVITKGRAAIKAFTDQVSGGSGAVASMRTQVLQLAGAFIGLQAIGDVGRMLQQADRNAYGLASSIKAANREFEVGSASDWERTIADLSARLKIYSESDIRGAAAATIDMTKRLGLNAAQMRQVIALSGDLASGRTDLAGAVERVTAALRGEAEASEYLGLTLNETYVKAWYEAKGAMQGAWKDLDDLQKAQVRYNVFLEQASPLQGKAAESINTYDGALKLIRKTVSDSITGNAALVDSLAQVATVLRENSGEIGSFVGAMASGAASVIEFVATNRELILTVGKYTLIFGAAVAVIGRLIATVKGLNAAIVVLTGAGIIPWFQRVLTAGNSTAAGLMLLQTAFIRLSVAAGAFIAAYKGGNALYRAVWMSEASKQLELFRFELEKTKATYERFASFVPEQRQSIIGKSAEELEQYKRALEGAYRYQMAVVQSLYAESKKTGFFGGETDEAKKAELELIKAKQRLQELERAMEEYGSVVHATNRENASSTASSAAAMKQATGAALDEMRKKYQDYAREIRTIQQDILGRERSLAAELRDMSRTGMSDQSIWFDRKKEAEEYAAAAKRSAQEAQAALAAGDTISAGEKFKEAAQYADDAKAAYKQLNVEVKDGERVVIGQQQALRTAMDGVKSSGELAIKILKDQQAATRAAMEDLRTKSGFADLSAGMDEAEQRWLANWEKMEKFASDQIGAVEKRIDGMVKDRHVTVYVTEKIKRAQGGVAFRLSGGGSPLNLYRGRKLPGFGGGDKIDASLEAGEMVINKYATAAMGLRGSYAWNNQQWGIVLEELLKRTRTSLADRVGYSLGGLSGFKPGSPQVTPSSPGYSGTLTFATPDGHVGRVFGSEVDVRAIERAIKKQQRYSSGKRS